MQGGAVFFTADALSKLSHWKRESTASTFLRCSWFRRVLSFPSITNFSWPERERLHAVIRMQVAHRLYVVVLWY